MFQVVWSSVVHAFWCYSGSVVYIFQPFLNKSKEPYNYRNFCSFHPPHSFNFDFKVFVFWAFFSYFNWRVLFGGNGHINEQAPFFLFVLDYNVGSVGLHLMICRYWHIPQGCDVVFLSYCLGLKLAPFLVCVYIHLVADVPVKVCGSFVVSVKVFCFGQLRAPCHNMVNIFLKLTTNPAHWVCTIF